MAVSAALGSVWNPIRRVSLGVRRRAFPRRHAWRDHALGPVLIGGVVSSGASAGTHRWVPHTVLPSVEYDTDDDLVPLFLFSM